MITYALTDSNFRLSRRRPLSRIAGNLFGALAIRNALAHVFLGQPMLNLSRVFVVLLFCTAVNGCGSRVIKADDGAPPVYRMDDGSLCEAPAGFPDILQTPGTRQARALFLSSTSPEETAAGVPDLPSREELGAALYVSCGEYANGKLSRSVFKRQRDIYQELRLKHLEHGVQGWLDDPEGYQSPGKVCLFIFSGDNPDMRNLTWLVPKQTTFDDCALHVGTNGGTHVRLGCSAGSWKMHWAPKRLLVGPNGWAKRHRPLAGTQYVPVPDCGWS